MDGKVGIHPLMQHQILLLQGPLPNFNSKLQTSSTTGLSFPSIEVASGATLTIDAGKDVTISHPPTYYSYQSGNFINNGTVIMNSDATNFSSLIIEGEQQEILLITDG